MTTSDIKSWCDFSDGSLTSSRRWRDSFRSRYVEQLYLDMELQACCWRPARDTFPTTWLSLSNQLARHIYPPTLPGCCDTHLTRHRDSCVGKNCSQHYLSLPNMRCCSCPHVPYGISLLYSQANLSRCRKRNAFVASMH